ncbi:hypothetical protein OH77DRAFT_1426445 [Trametes cingulata]|nr:hypothetical protein OH77DRAFT_1426445 [Trametes cingulata]
MYVLLTRLLGVSYAVVSESRAADIERLCAPSRRYFFLMATIAYGRCLPARALCQPCGPRGASRGALPHCPAYPPSPINTS